MPILTQDRNKNHADAQISRSHRIGIIPKLESPVPQTTPSFSETFGRSFVSENIFANIDLSTPDSTVKQVNQYFGTDEDSNQSDFNPYTHAKEHKGELEDVWEYILGGGVEYVASPEQFDARIEKFRAEKANRERIAEGSGFAGMAGGTIGAILDPTAAIPVATILKAAKVGKFVAGSVNTSAAALSQAAIQETTLHLLQTQRTLEESGINIGASMIFGGVLGGVAPSIKSLLHPKNPNNPLHPDNPPTFGTSGGKNPSGGGDIRPTNDPDNPLDLQPSNYKENTETFKSMTPTERRYGYSQKADEERLNELQGKPTPKPKEAQPVIDIADAPERLPVEIATPEELASETKLLTERKDIFDATDRADELSALLDKELKLKQAADGDFAPKALQHHLEKLGKTKRIIDNQIAEVNRNITDRDLASYYTRHFMGRTHKEMKKEIQEFPDAMVADMEQAIVNNVEELQEKHAAAEVGSAEEEVLQETITNLYTAHRILDVRLKDLEKVFLDTPNADVNSGYISDVRARLQQHKSDYRNVDNGGNVSDIAEVEELFDTHPELAAVKADKIMLKDKHQLLETNIADVERDLVRLKKKVESNHKPFDVFSATIDDKDFNRAYKELKEYQEALKDSAEATNLFDGRIRELEDGLPEDIISKTRGLRQGILEARSRLRALENAFTEYARIAKRFRDFSRKEQIAFKRAHGISLDTNINAYLRAKTPKDKLKDFDEAVEKTTARREKEFNEHLSKKWLERPDSEGTEFVLLDREQQTKYLDGIQKDIHQSIDYITTKTAELEQSFVKEEKAVVVREEEAAAKPVEPRESVVVKKPKGKAKKAEPEITTIRITPDEQIASLEKNIKDFKRILERDRKSLERVVKARDKEGQNPQVKWQKGVRAKEIEDSIDTWEGVIKQDTDALNKLREANPNAKPETYELKGWYGIHTRNQKAMANRDPKLLTKNDREYGRQHLARHFLENEKPELDRLWETNPERAAIITERLKTKDRLGTLQLLLEAEEKRLRKYKRGVAGYKKGLTVIGEDGKVSDAATIQKAHDKLAAEVKEMQEEYAELEKRFHELLELEKKAETEVVKEPESVKPDLTVDAPNTTNNLTPDNIARIDDEIEDTIAKINKNQEKRASRIERGIDTQGLNTEAQHLQRVLETYQNFKKRAGIGEEKAFYQADVDTVVKSAVKIEKDKKGTKYSVEILDGSKLGLTPDNLKLLKSDVMTKPSEVVSYIRKVLDGDSPTHSPAMRATMRALLVKLSPVVGGKAERGIPSLEGLDTLITNRFQIPAKDKNDPYRTKAAEIQAEIPAVIELWKTDPALAAFKTARLVRSHDLAEPSSGGALPAKNKAELETDLAYANKGIKFLEDTAPDKPQPSAPSSSGGSGGGTGFFGGSKVGSGDDEFGGSSATGSVGAAAVGDASLNTQVAWQTRILRALAKTLGKVNPIIRLLFSRNKRARDMAVKLVNTGGLITKANSQGQAVLSAADHKDMWRGRWEEMRIGIEAEFLELKVRLADYPTTVRKERAYKTGAHYRGGAKQFLQDVKRPVAESGLPRVVDLKNNGFDTVYFQLLQRDYIFAERINDKYIGELTEAFGEKGMRDILKTAKEAAQDVRTLTAEFARELARLGLLDVEVANRQMEAVVATKMSDEKLYEGLMDAWGFSHIYNPKYWDANQSDMIQLVKDKLSASPSDELLSTYNLDLARYHQLGVGEVEVKYRGEDGEEVVEKVSINEGKLLKHHISNKWIQEDGEGRIAQAEQMRTDAELLREQYKQHGEILTAGILATNSKLKGALRKRHTTEGVVKQLQKQITAARNEKKKLQEELDTLKADPYHDGAAAERIRQEIDRLSAEVDTNRKDKKALQDNLEDIKSVADNFSEEVGNARRARTYTKRERAKLKTLLDKIQKKIIPDIEDAMNVNEYASKLVFAIAGGDNALRSPKLRNEVADTNRIKLRTIDWTPEEKLSLMERGAMRADLYPILEETFTDLASLIGLRRAFNITDGADNTEVLRRITQEVLEHERIEAVEIERNQPPAKATKMIRELHKDTLKAKDDLQGLVQRVLGYRSANRDREDWGTWIADRMKDLNYSIYSSHFGLSSLTDLSTVNYQKGFAFNPDEIADMSAIMRDAKPHEVKELIDFSELDLSREELLNGVSHQTDQAGIGNIGTVKHKTTSLIQRGLGSTARTASWLTGLQSTNRFFKTMGIVKWESDLIKKLDNLEAINQKALYGNKEAEVWIGDLASLGLGIPQLKMLRRQIKKHGTINHRSLRETGSRRWQVDEEGRRAFFLLRTARKNKANRIIQTPQEGDTPLVMDRVWASVMFQFMTYSFITVNKFLLPATQRIGANPRDLNTIASLSSAVFLGYVIVMAKDVVRHGEVKDRSPQQWVLDSMDRSGLLSWGSPLLTQGLRAAGLQGSDRWGHRQNIQLLLGASASTGNNLLGLGQAALRGDGDRTWEQTQKLLPLQLYTQMVRQITN